MSDTKGRIHPCLISAFIDLTSGSPSPHILRLWTGIGLVSALMERRCWIKTSTGKLHPNTFIVLVAPPGVGKSVAIDRARNLIAATGKYKLAPQSLTKAGLIDVVKASIKTQKFEPEGMPEIYSPLTVLSPELGILLPAHDTSMLNVLNELYDCGNKFQEYIRSKGMTEFEKPCLSFLAGTQPKFLANLLPEEAWGMGFTSRIIMVYAGEKVDQDYFDSIIGPDSFSLESSIIKDLKLCAQVGGQFVISEEAKSVFRNWQESGFSPVPDHGKLAHYNTRRPTHALKLSMVSSFSKSSDLVISGAHMEEAINWMLGAEDHMTEIFKEMIPTVHKELIEEVFRFLMIRFNRTQKFIPESSVVSFLSARLPANMINYTIDNLINGNVITVKVAGPVGNRGFAPGSINEGD